MADLKANEADVQAGNLVPGEVVSDSIQKAIDRFEARLAGAPQREIAPGR
jgi:hypothetical protein